MRVIYITAGAAGMYCGSCMRDNTLVRALRAIGVDAVLVPTYTPILTDGEDVSARPIFFGGIGVYLAHRFPLLRRMPRLLARLLAAPALLRLASRIGVRNRPEDLGELTLSVLAGERGHHRRELEELADWLEREGKPDVIHLTNSLFAGLAPYLRERLGVPIVCTLQGEDLFIEGLPEPYRCRALARIGEAAASIDAFVAVSEHCRRHMVRQAGLDADKVLTIPPALTAEVARRLASAGAERGAPGAGDAPPPPVTIGYLARICEEKGAGALLRAFAELRSRPGTDGIRLELAGYLGAADRERLAPELARLGALGLAADVVVRGTVTLEQKIEFLSRIDVFCVPAVYPEPKGLYVLEAFAAGLPVVVPDHGAFPELVAACGSGRLVTPASTEALADELHRLAFDSGLRRELGRTARAGAAQRFSDERMARATLDVYRRLLPS